MSEIKAFVWGAMAWILRLVLWVLAAGLALLLLGVALVLLLVGVLWALVRGKRPTAPVFVGRFQRFTTERVWPGRAGQRSSATGANAKTADVVDVEVREVVDVQTRLSSPSADPGAAPPDGEGRRP